jgi:hypothetical protein
MRFEVPQFIEVEDKIFGPFTWRQFLYLSGGVGMATVLFFTTPFLVFVLLGLPIAVLAGALSFYPVNNRPFSFFLEAVINYLTRDHLYLWRHNKDIVHKSNTRTEVARTAFPETQQQTRKHRDINSLARDLELEAMQKAE